jgi:hypothetical protein
VLRQPIVVEIVLLTQGNRRPLKFPFAIDLRKVRLERVAVPAVGGIIVMIVVDAHDQHHDARLDARPQPLQQKKLLVGAVGGDAGVDDAGARQSLPQPLGESLFRLHAEAIDEGIADHHDGRPLAWRQLDVAQPDAVEPVSQWRDLVRDRVPAELGIVLVGQPELLGDQAHFPEVSDAQE